MVELEADIIYKRRLLKITFLECNARVVLGERTERAIWTVST